MRLQCRDVALFYRFLSYLTLDDRCFQRRIYNWWVYTTSFRSERYIRALFRCYGIKWDAVVNGERHAREVQADKKYAMPSKYPGKYRIDLHIDDDISVKQNGIVYGFKVFIIGGQDEQWTDKIKQEIKNIIEINYKGTNDLK